MAAPIRFLTGRQQQQKIGVIGSTEDTKVLEVIGRVGIGTTIFDPSTNLDIRNNEGSIKIGDLQDNQGSTDNGIVFVASTSGFSQGGITSYRAGLFTEVNGRILSYGINAIQLETERDINFPGGIFRLDTRNAGGWADSDAFVIKRQPVGVATSQSDAGEVNGLVVKLTSGNTYAVPNGGTLLVGTASTISLTEGGPALPVEVGSDIKLQVGAGSTPQGAYISGSVGIGTTNPIADLDVVGLTELDNLNVSGIATVGTFGVSGLTTTNKLKVVGLSTFESNVDINASVDISNNLTVDGLSDLDELNVAGIATFRNNVEFFGPSSVQLTWDSVEDILRFKDDVAAYFGDGDDLRIFHNGSDSYISDGGVGNLNIISNGLGVSIKKSGTEPIANFNTDGSVELYYDNSKKFETTGIGVSIVNGTSDTATIYGPSNLIIDPMPVGVGTTSGIVRIKGDLYVDGTQFVVSSSTIELADFVVGIATTVPNDILLDGAGIGIGTNKTFLYEYNSGNNPSLKSSENLNVASGKVYQIAETERLSADTLSLGTGTTIHSPGSNRLTFGTNGQERVRIDSSGDVGIGTDNPQTKLHVEQTTEGEIVRFRASNDTLYLKISSFNAGFDGSGFDFNATSNAGEISFSTQNVEKVRIDNAGNLGIGTNAPTAKLDVRGTANVTGVSTFASAVDINAGLDVDGFTELDATNISETLNVVGLTTFGSNVDINASVDISTNLVVDGLSDLDELNVAGISTFASNVDINAGLDVDGYTELDSTNISETLNVVGLSTFASNVDINAGLDVDGYTELDATNISETLNVVGLSTFASNVDINAGLDVDGHTELDTLNVSIATTTASLTLANAGVAATAILDEDLFTSNRADALATQQSIKAYVDAQVTAQDLDIQGDTGGALSIDLDSEVLTIAGTASEIETSGSGNTITIGLPNQVAITTSLVVGSGVTITGSTVQVGGTITELYNGTFWNVVTQADVGYGASQVPLNQYLGQLAFLDDYHPNGLRRDGGGSDDVFVDSNGLVGINTTSPTSTLDVNGTLNVAGISTFASDIDINASIDVDGHTELDDLNVSGVSTFVGVGTFQSDLYVGGNFEVAGTSEFIGVVTFRGGTINIGDSDADDVVVGGEFASNLVPTTDGLYDLGTSGKQWRDLYITGMIDTDQLNVSGLSTFASAVDINAGLDVDGRTELDTTNISETLNVVGLSTFGSNVDINASVDISTNLVVDGLSDLDELNVAGIATFNTDVEFVGSTVGVTSAYWDSSENLLNFKDDVKATFGDSDDLQIYHDGSHSWIRDEGAGHLYIRTNGDRINLNSDTGSLAKFNKGGSVELYYDDSKKFETTGYGVTVSGGVYVSGISTFQNNIEVTGNIEFDNITTTGAATATLTTLTETPIHTGLSASTYRSVEYTIQATEGTNFHSAKVLVVHDGTTAYHSEYGTIYNNTPVATFNADVSGGNLRLLAAGESSNSTVYKIHFIATKV